MTDENDMFQIEIVEIETVYACNICDQGFEGSDEVKKHITKVHHDINNHILKKVKDSYAYFKLDKGLTEEIIGVEDSGNEGTNNKDNKSEIQQEDGKFTCTLCYERLDGNHESKKHFI